jgi:hypothetical protein
LSVVISNSIHLRMTTFALLLCLITYFDTFTHPLLTMIQQLNAGALYKLQYRSFSIPFAKKIFVI